MKYNIEIDLWKSYWELKDEWITLEVLYRIHVKEVWDEYLCKSRFCEKLRANWDNPAWDIILTWRRNRKAWSLSDIYNRHLELCNWEKCNIETIKQRIQRKWDVETTILTPFMGHWWSNKNTWMKAKWNNYVWEKLSYDWFTRRLKKWMSFEEAINPKRLVRKKDNEDWEIVFW